jgi:hypothetical protein
MFRIVISLTSLMAVCSVAYAQQCNPAIDGTYCESAPVRKSKSPASETRVGPQEGLGSGLALPFDQPATLGAITFSGGSRCIGLLRRVNCN